MYKNINEEQTIERLTKAMQRHQPVTVSYVKADGQHVLRTIEIYEIPEELTKGGKQIVRALDRETGQTRSWRIDRIVEFVIHRSRYTVERCPQHNTGTEHCAHMDHSPAPESRVLDLPQTVGDAFVYALQAGLYARP